MNFFKILISIFILAITISSCKKDDPDTNQDAGKAELSALVGNANWNSSGDGPYSPIGAVGIKNTTLNIQVMAYGSDGSYIALNVVSTTGITEKTYVSSTGEFQGQYKKDFMSTDGWLSLLGSGTLTFTNISDSNISGTFNFDGVHPTMGNILVTGGKFNIDL